MNGYNTDLLVIYKSCLIVPHQDGQQFVALKLPNGHFLSVLADGKIQEFNGSMPLDKERFTLEGNFAIADRSNEAPFQIYKFPVVI